MSYANYAYRLPSPSYCATDGTYLCSFLSFLFSYTLSLLVFLLFFIFRPFPPLQLVVLIHLHIPAGIGGSTRPRHIEPEHLSPNLVRGHRCAQTILHTNLYPCVRVQYGWDVYKVWQEVME